MSEPTIVPAANSIEALRAAVSNYKQQHSEASAHLVQVEATYHQQKDTTGAILHMLNGALAALEQVIKNIEDEAAATVVDALAREAEANIKIEADLL